MNDTVRLNIFEILERVEKATSRADKIKILQTNESVALKDVLRATYDDVVQFLLPQGAEPPYEPAPESSPPTNLLKQNTQLRYFVDTPFARQVNSIKRERIFINLLESIHPQDAKVMLKVINKQQLGKGITKKLVQEAYPNLISK